MVLGDCFTCTGNRWSLWAWLLGGQQGNCGLGRKAWLVTYGSNETMWWWEFINYVRKLLRKSQKMAYERFFVGDLMYSLVSRESVGFEGRFSLLKMDRSQLEPWKQSSCSVLILNVKKLWGWAYAWQAAFLPQLEGRWDLIGLHKKLNTVPSHPTMGLLEQLFGDLLLSGYLVHIYLIFNG